MWANAAAVKKEFAMEASLVNYLAVQWDGVWDQMLAAEMDNEMDNQTAEEKELNLAEEKDIA